MFPIRRAALRLLSTPSPASFIHSQRTISSVSATALRISRQQIPLKFQQRWLSSEAEAKKEEVPISKLQPTSQEEVHNAINEDGAIQEPRSTESAEAEQRPPPIAETANATEATEESIPASEQPIEQNDTFGRSNTNRTPRPAFQPPAPKTTVYVGNLFFDVTEDDLKKEMTRFGQVDSVRLIRDPRGLSKGFGYVTFSEVEAAGEAIAGLNQQLFEGRRLSVQYASREVPNQRGSGSQGINNPGKTLFIGNMSWETTDGDLTKLFKGIKNVVDVRVAIDRRTGKPRGFAHADFTDIKSAVDAFGVLQGQELYGRTLRIDYSPGSNAAPRNQARDAGRH